MNSLNNDMRKFEIEEAVFVILNEMLGYVLLVIITSLWNEQFFFMKTTILLLLQRKNSVKTSAQ